MGVILGGNFLVGNCPGGSYPGWKFSGWELSWWELSWVGFSGWELAWVGIFLGGNFPGGNCPVGIVRVGVFLVPIKQPDKKQCPTFLSFPFLIDCCMSVFFSFLIKTLLNFEKMIKFYG